MHFSGKNNFFVSFSQNCTAFGVAGVDYLHLSNLLLLLLLALSLILVIRGDTNATDNAIYADLMPYSFICAFSGQRVCMCVCMCVCELATATLFYKVCSTVLL